MAVVAIRWSRVFDAALATWFVTLSAVRASALIPGALFTDSRLYVRATADWLAGRDPWATNIGGLHYAAPPPSLLPLAPFAVLPEDLAVTVLLALGIVASFWALRRLGLPWWWIAWPPLVDNLLNGNPQIFVIPLLLGPLAWLAPMVKVYAFVPLLIRARWRTIGLTAIALAITAPLLPWGPFVSEFGSTSAALARQANGGMSAWAFPVLVPFALLGLLAMGRQRAAWWTVPALWPSTQWYYSLMAMPALTPLTAAILAVPIQGIPAVAAVVAAIEVWWLRRLHMPAEATVVSS